MHSHGRDQNEYFEFYKYGAQMLTPPYTLHPPPYTLHPTPSTLHPTPYTLHPTPYTLHAKSYCPIAQNDKP